MRILLISNLFPPHYIGGYEIGAKEYGEALRDRGHDVLALTSDYHATRDELNSDWVRRAFRENLDYDGILAGDVQLSSLSRQSYFRSHIWDRRNEKVIRQALTDFRPDLVYAWKCEGLSIAPVWIPLAQKIPVVVHLCDDWLLKYRSYRLREMLSSRMALVLGLMHARLKRAILFATSSAIRRMYEGAGFPEENLHVVHYGLADHHWKKASFARRPETSRRILFVGQLWEGKGVHHLIEAVRILNERSPTQGYTLDIIGSCLKDYEERLKGMVRSYELESRITFHGKKQREELWAMYDAYDMMVMPSTWPEPQGNTLLEAMVNGLPVLASRVGGLTDVIEDGRSGILFEAGNPAAIADAIRRVSEEEGVARRLAEGAIHLNSRKFNLSTIIPEIETLFQKEVLASGRSA